MGGLVGTGADHDRQTVVAFGSQEPRKEGISVREIARLKVTLEGIRPPIWRRLEVPLEFSFAQLSDVIVAAFGWSNSHLHEFEIGKRSEVGQRRIGVPDPDEDEAGPPPTDAELAELFPWLTVEEARKLLPPPLQDEETVILGELLRDEKRFRYVYDFGDDWRHSVLVEAIMAAERETVYPRVTAGRRAAPPEDCGGVWGYEHLLEVLADRDHEEHAELREWCPRQAPDEFDLAAADEAVRNPPEYWDRVGRRLAG